MATWDEFAEVEPEMAELGLRQLKKFGLAYLGTIRKDGSPRVNPIAPLIVDGHLVICTPKTSPKGRDQVRDGRCVIHLLPGRNDDEFLIRARARIVEDASVWVRAQAAAHWVHDGDFLFEYDIESVMSAHWERVGQPGTYPVRKFWRAP